jgi:Uma2 family endonuclease
MICRSQHAIGSNAMSLGNHTTGNQPPDLHDWNAVPASPPALRMSEDAFEAWILASEGVRAEWVDGVVQMMSPSNDEHTDLNVWLVRLIGDFAEGKNLGGKVKFDFMIRLAGGKTRRIPDVLYVTEARRSLLTRNYLNGPPDLAVEIISNDSTSRDWREKYNEYEAAGVREYWIVDPFTQQIEAYALGEENKYVRIAEVEGKIPSTVLAGLYLRNEWLWADPRPTVRSLFGELGI